MRTLALEIAKNALGWDSPEYQTLKISQQGLFRAIATAQREPLSHTIVRALERGEFLEISAYTTGDRSKAGRLGNRNHFGKPR